MSGWFRRPVTRVTKHSHLSLNVEAALGFRVCDSELRRA